MGLRWIEKNLNYRESQASTLEDIHASHKIRRMFATDCHRQHIQTHRTSLCRKQEFCRAITIFGIYQIRCGTKGEAEIAEYYFGNLVEHDDDPKCSVLLKLHLSNAIKSLNTETMLNHVFSNHLEL